MLSVFNSLKFLLLIHSFASFTAFIFLYVEIKNYIYFSLLILAYRNSAKLVSSGSLQRNYRTIFVFLMEFFCVKFCHMSQLCSVLKTLNIWNLPYILPYLINCLFNIHSQGCIALTRVIALDCIFKLLIFSSSISHIISNSFYSSYLPWLPVRPLSAP